MILLIKIRLFYRRFWKSAIHKEMANAKLWGEKMESFNYYNVHPPELEG